ncbi:hypothetical protein VKT23_001205 [Stygiomarasmius scandens]|uniref:Uncharacterized protein n=1 Tax=Marasmiellus scandens TaxID=2682957 RepID=A0ABR1K919_9AGAR
MRPPLALWLAATLIATNGASRVPLTNVLSDNGSSSLVPGEYIVERSVNLRRSVAQSHEPLYHSIRSKGIIFDIKKEWNEPDIMVGALVNLLDPNDALRIAELPDVRAIHPVSRIPPPKPKTFFAVNDPNDPLIPADTLSTHIMTGVDKLHAEGNFGQGIKIGIIDSGVDYTHPVLGSCIGPSCKIVGGYDFVGDAFSGENKPAPDSDPLDQCNGHGTHVAGIIGANPGNEFNITGVAPGASLTVYRVFGCEGGTADDIIIDALIRGYKDGQDILTLSLGNVNGWTENMVSVVASRIASKGVVVTIAAGNDGEFGSWYSSSPGSAINAITVASVEKCAQKLANAAAKGGKIFLIYNTRTGSFAPIEVGNFTAALISSDDGEYASSLVKQFVAGTNITLSFPQTGASANVENSEGGLISDFSSYGPTFDMYLKPAVAAPGGNILSTIPVKLGSFAVESGTSMATPFCAGAVALILNAKKDWPFYPALSIRDLLQSTAASVSSSKTDSDLLQTASQQGAGLIQVHKAIYAKTVISPTQLHLNDTSNLESQHVISVTNIGDDEAIYELRHVPAGTAISIDAHTKAANVWPVPLVNASATVTFGTSKLVIPPGQTADVELKFEPPTALDPSTLPIYSGFIEFQSQEETLKVTYMGVVGSLKDEIVLDSSDSFFGAALPTILNDTGDVQTGPQNYTFVGEDVPKLLLRLLFGTPKLLVDLVNKDANISTTIPNHSKRDVLLGIHFNLGLQGFDNTPQVNTLGTLGASTYVPRNSDAATALENGWNAYAFDKVFANGTTIPNGQYRVLVRALRVTGNPENESDYESWLSPVIGVFVPDS